MFMLQILFNKAILDQFSFPFPMFLTTWHMFLATILTQIMSKTTNMLPGVREVILFKFFFFSFHFFFFSSFCLFFMSSCKQNKVDMKVLQKQLIPVAVFFSFSLVLSNKAYIYLSVSYIQVLFL